jgi:hypothetical protein
VSTGDQACGCASLPLLGDCANDAHDALVISLIRFVFVGYCTGRVDAWDHGCEAAIGALGLDAGTTFFGHVLALGRAVRAERAGNFNFLPATCPHVSEDEMELLAAMQAARSPDRRRLDQALFVLARKLDQARLTTALTNLASLLHLLRAEQGNAPIMGTAAHRNAGTGDRRKLH